MDNTFTESEITPEGYLKLKVDKIKGSGLATSIKDECLSSEELLPSDKNGLVIASGNSTEKWRGKGWKTLDIDRSNYPDFPIDIRHMDEQIKPDSFDYILLDGLPMNKNGGVELETVIQQTRNALKNGGKLFFQTSIDDEGYSRLPTENEISQTLIKNGFGFEGSKSGPIQILDQNGTPVETYRSAQFFAEKLVR
ncbi:MAG: hypothetical protein UT39_C0004G0059 [Candidatus Woesebacteria bacterium GW2011_GWA1_39_21]|uniref:Methyltransferase type 11 domain-containing protein n=1 Tax=Candidatus Woesebacteria bacterium GW2011_GWA1_39_21 TaxID=1618550 RepID=A0A0G0QMV4_9BACT|nr:MAG: hypothetical protein UT39_C0004G0059 [Candidatus Woesebacteria bacterium GW2011_GWA1_39_21]